MNRQPRIIDAATANPKALWIDEEVLSGGLDEVCGGGGGCKVEEKEDGGEEDGGAGVAETLMVYHVIDNYESGSEEIIFIIFLHWTSYISSFIIAS